MGEERSAPVVRYSTAASLNGSPQIPLLRALRIYPIVVSAPLITTVVDGTGLLIYSRSRG